MFLKISTTRLYTGKKLFFTLMGMSNNEKKEGKKIKNGENQLTNELVELIGNF